MAKTIKKSVLMMALVCLSLGVFAQELHREINTQQYSPSFPEALKIDISKPPSAELFSLPQSNHPSRQANNGWYPVKGEIYCSPSETEVAGYIYHEIGQNGLLDKKIIVANHPSLYDSTVSFMNRTPYTKGKNLFDTTYNYRKKTDGTYQLDLRRIYSYHYFDHFEADSFYYETIYHKWDNANDQWTNWIKQKFGFRDTLVEFYNRLADYYSYGQGDTWATAFYSYDSVTYNHQGFVDTLYMIRDMGNGDKLPKHKLAFTYNEQGRYTQIDYFNKSGNNWNKDAVHSDVTWTEWHGFTYNSNMVIGTEWVSPYKRNKVESYYIDNDGRRYFRQKWWDINGTKSNSDTLWIIIDGKPYRNTVINNIYNEYGDYVEWRNTYYSPPDENGEQTLQFYSATYHKYTYDEIYGMTEHMVYLIQFDKDEGLDTTIFIDGFKYTDFATVSIVEHPQPSKQALSIYPNPTSGAVIILATAEIEQLCIFDITGRLVNSQSPENKQVVFDTGVLPQGIYLVQARLKGGGAQTGKVVVR